MAKRRRKYTAEQKVAILKEHLVEGSRLSDLCDAYDLHPTAFYLWQKEFFEKEARQAKALRPFLCNTGTQNGKV